MSQVNTILNRKELKAAWNEFVSTGEVRNGVVRDEILESWKRCRSYGLDPHIGHIVTDISEEDKKRIIAENMAMIETARPFLKSLYEVIKNMEMVVFLTDKDGFVLDAIGEGAIWEYCQAKNAFPGSSFHEKYTGTNAPALAIRLNTPFQMMAEEHYLEAVHVAMCAAAPIHDEHDTIIGSLDLTAKYEIALKHPHTLGMIVAGAQVIENQLRLKKELERSFLTSQYLKAAMETMLTGLVILDRDNVITHINPAAEKVLGVSASTISDRNIKSIIKNQTISRAIDRSEEMTDCEVILNESIGKGRFLVSLKPIPSLQGERMGNVLLFKDLKLVQQLMQKVAGLHAQYTFQDILGNSREIKETIKLAEAVAENPSNVIIVGESGTGKEMLAQSIHNASPWSHGPFLAINCAAIPHGLIESELFGYEAGTFTGGARGGKSGKLELANGGTLFLDEVNGMSLDMQAKLLRVLDEKKFQRLGGQTFFHLEARIIAATNRDLQEEVEKGNFRGDLYYRLSVFEIQVPPLRARKGDIELLVRVFTREVSRNIGKKIEGVSPESLSYLKNHPWPGNIRQLKNWIERAVNLTEGALMAPADFPVEKQSTEPLGQRPSLPDHEIPTSSHLGQVERDTIHQVLEACGGNMTETARRLGIGRATLYRKLKKYDLAVARTVST